MVTANNSMQTHIYSSALMTDPEYVTAAGGRIGIFSTRSPDPAHEHNEDAAAIFILDDDRAVLVLADGAGGTRGGEIASGMALEQLRRAVEAGRENGVQLRSAIIDGFENSNRAIIDQGIGAATTLAVIEIDAGIIRSYHAGDSAVIAVGQRGKLKLQTVAHSPVGYAVESGVIDAKDAMRHDERHIVSNIVGIPGMHIEVGPPLELARRDTVVIASDGLTDNLHNGEIVEMVRKGPLETVMQNLIATVRRRMRNEAGSTPSKMDDCTFMIYRRSG